jgi:hypothetical protein
LILCKWLEIGIAMTNEIHDACTHSLHTAIDVTTIFIVRTECEQVLDLFEPARNHPMRPSPKASQMRCALDTNNPLSFSIRELQWVASLRLYKVSTTEASMRASSMPTTSHTFATKSRSVESLHASSRRPSNALSSNSVSSLRIRGVGHFIVVPLGDDGTAMHPNMTLMS